MFKISFFLLLIVITSTNLFSQQQSDTSKVLVKFNEPMSREGIFNINNYVIYRDEATPIAIYKVGIVPGDTAVVLYTERYIPQSSYMIIINNLRDKAGNIINESHKMAFY
ncbi:MAG: hypothetical protein IPJ23_05200 [Ignavibacteriales bacterium]|nr:hypothetical protein [Ignavibacteriales bacterium]